MHLQKTTTIVKTSLFASLALMLAFFVPAQKAWSQVVTATLTGTVSDTSGAVVAGATVIMKNEASGDLRRTVSNGEGFFTITAVPPGVYTVAVEAKGFNKFEQKGVSLNAGDKRNLSDIALAVGSGAETVTVEATVDEITTVDSGEKAAVIGTKQLQNIAVVGANAAEFIKILPGMALTSGTQNEGYSGEVAGTNSGPIGSFSANGQRTGALDITSDGAHVIDPGCNCGQAVNVNIDMTQEMKVLTSNFGADAQKGPVFISAVGKSGGAQFHGQGYFYARHNAMNANDSLNNAQGRGADGNPLAPKPLTKYLYPGGNIGGPVLIPGTNFNKNRDKLFFFFGYEYYKQDVDNGIYQSFVPTQEMRNGNYAQSYLDSLHGKQDIGYNVSGAASKFPGGIVPASEINKIGQNLMALYPTPNANAATTGGFNYVNVSTKPQNAYQLRPRIDWSISDNTKLFVSYNRQRDTAYYTDTLWWRPTPTVPYPTRLIAANLSDSVSANLTKVFSPTLTNEFVFTYTLLDLPNSFENPSKVDPSALGVSYPTIFKAGLKEITTMTGWGGGFANMIQPSGFQITGSLYAKKKLPTISDNMTKVAGTHTMKFGFYWEATSNDQPSSNNANGQAQFANWGGNSTGNAYADLLTGRIAAYSETNKDVLLVMKYQTVDFYAQDSWKVSRRLTLDFGMRFSHLGPWNDQRGAGLAVFDASKYSDNPADVNKLTGVLWNSIDKSVPLGGMGTRNLFFNPRGGFAWDVMGSGKTVIRGGVGVYRFHDEQNVQAGALNITQGVYGYSTPQAVTFDQIGSYSSSNFIAPGGLTVLDRKDDNQPKTTSYSFTISQRTPLSSLLEVSYVGNKSTYLSNWNNNFGGLDLLPWGALFKTPGTFANSTDPNADPLRPYHNYQSIKVINHQMYSNYNSLQVSWNKQSGRINYLANYTFSKALGIRGEGGAPTGDPTNLANNYGTLPNDRTHIFNLAYVVQLPDVVKKNAVAKGLVNGWQISGITQFQSGSNLQASSTNNFGVSSTIPAGTTLPDGTVLTSSVGASPKLINGTPDINIQPVLTCDPRNNLGPNQFINASCFAPPTPGHNGPFIMPYIKGPAFFNNDLSLFKNFNISEHKKLQFRASAYNFLNHPLRSFINGDNNLLMNFDSSGKITNSRFGYADWTLGKRIVQLAVKFYF